MDKRYKVIIAQSGKIDVKNKKHYIIKISSTVNMLKIFHEDQESS